MKQTTLKPEVTSPRDTFFERAAIFGAVLAIAACVVEAEPCVTVTPETGHEAQVEEAVSAWNDAVGCEVLAVAPGGLIVRFYDDASWPEGDNVRGFYDETEIGIRRTVYQVERGTLVHELGHALGAEHGDDPAGVMWPNVSIRYIPTPSDVALLDATLRECR